MSWLKVGLGVVGLYGAALGAEVTALRWLQGKKQAQLERMAALAREHALKPGDALPLFGTACHGKVPVGEAQALLGFTFAWDEETFVHLEQNLLYEEEHLSLTTRDARALGTSVSVQHELDPTTWAAHLKKASRDAADLEKAKFLVVARYGDIEPSKVTATGFIPGRSTFGARVISVPSGEVVCEGRGVPTMKDTIEGNGRARTASEAQADASRRAEDMVHFTFKQGLLVTPLHTLCKAGGDVLCTETVRWAGYHPGANGE